MDKFESGAPIQAFNNRSLSPSPVAPASLSQQRYEPAGEVVLHQESESVIPHTSSEVDQYSTQIPTYNLAETLFADVKIKGIDQTLRDFASGKYTAYQSNTERTEEQQETIDFTVRRAEKMSTIHEKLIDLTETSSDETNRERPPLEKDDMVEAADQKDTKTSISQYIAKEVDDPMFSQKLGEVANERIIQGDELDPDSLRDEALGRYVIEKNGVLPPSLEEKVIAIESEFADLLNENESLHIELQQFKQLARNQSETLQVMALALLEMARKLRDEKEEEEEKMSMLELMIRLMGLLLQEFTKVEGQKIEGIDLPEGKNKKKVEKSDMPDIDLSKIELPDFKKLKMDKNHSPSSTPIAA